jgi:hypothetical protein
MVRAPDGLLKNVISESAGAEWSSAILAHRDRDGCCAVAQPVVPHVDFHQPGG